MVLININRAAAAEDGASTERWLPPENTQVTCEIADVDVKKFEDPSWPHVRFGFKIAVGYPDAGKLWYGTVFVKAYNQNCASKPMLDLLDIFFAEQPDGQAVDLSGPALVKAVVAETVTVCLGKHRTKGNNVNAQIAGFIRSVAVATAPAVGQALLVQPAAAPPPAQPPPPPSNDDIPF